jgi:hypothetical protein
MRYILILLACMLYSCNSTMPVKSQVIVKDHYIVKAIPNDVFVIPMRVDPLDLNRATQKDLAIWIIKNEERSDELEMKLRDAKKIQDENIKSLEK